MGDHRAPGGQHRALAHLAARHPLHRGADQLQFGDDGLANALHLAQPSGRGGDDLTEGAEAVDQGFRQRLHVGAGDRAEQHQLKELVIGQRLAAGLPEAFAQPLAMAKKMRRGLFKAGGNGRLRLRIRPAVRPCPVARHAGSRVGQAFWKIGLS